jgi:gliding motility-associated-like protein
MSNSKIELPKLYFMIKRNNVLYRNYILLGLLLFSFKTYAQPTNDGCTNAINIPITNAGYGLGIFASTATNLTTATVQTGETFAPAIFVAGLDKKSVWYKFSIPTIRAVRVTLTQPGTTITAGDAGFAVYQTNNCLPGNTNISTKLTPIVTFGNTYHPCVPTGDYLIQVSSNLAANGPIIIQLEISDQTGAAYDHPNQAYAFGTVGYYARKIDFNTECQSIEDATEVCTAFSNPLDYNKTAWLTFKTPSYFDYMVLQLSGTGASYYFPSNNNQNIYRPFGYTLYKGDAVTTPIGSLSIIDGCDSLSTNGYYADYRVFKCGDLDTGTVYSIQIFIKKDFTDDIRVGILTGGQAPTKAPKPILSAIPAPNAIGVLPVSPAGTLTVVDDVWGCNSKHNNSICNPSLPDTGIMYYGGKYNLSSFSTFTLNSTCGINFDAYVTQCGTQPLVRVFKQGVTNSCTGLDTANIIGTFIRNGFIDCLQPGNYTVQVSGQDATEPNWKFNSYLPAYNAEQCLSNNLGTSFKLNITAYYRTASNKYSLSATGKFDSINRVGSAMQPLANGVTYSSISDTIGCQPTVQPIDTTCNPVNDKVIYRQFVVNDSGIVDFSNLTYSAYSPMRYRLYKGDANALASAQNVFAFPDKITGLKAITECLDYNTNCTNRTACVIPGSYTFTTMAGNADVGRADKPVFTFVRTRTKHNTPFVAQNLGSLWDTLGVGGGSINSDVDDWSCDDNAVAINGTSPCIIGGKPATKAIYRQFYLNKTSLVRIENIYYYYCYARAYGIKSLFYGKATDGFAGLSPVGGQWSCFPYAAGTTAGCDLLPPGWYTVVSYNQGPSYDSTFRSLNLEGRSNSAVSYNDEFKITITPSCQGPAFNRPYKASVNGSNLPHAIQFVNRVNSTPAYPRTDTTYVLPTEHFNCTVDTPFANHPIKACEPTANRVAYYVFKTTEECFLQINTGGYYAAVYNKDVRVDSLQFATLNPIQTCNYSAGYIQFCYFQPGTYTLVIFAKDANVCQSVTPSIYMDVTNKYSRFDYAKNAYDFGVVPPDSAWHYGKVGDVNPLNSGRKPSNDIFYCTTGASTTDPIEPACYVAVNPNVYNSGPNKPLYDSAFASNIYGVTRRNIWYTFVIDKPGYVTVKVESKTPAREYQQKFSVYRSNVDGTLPFSTVVSNGQVDSTAALGLTIIATNLQTWYYCANLANSVQFYRDPCSSIPTRYYVLVENVNAEPYEPGGTLPNTQTEMSILIDSINLIPPKHDHYSLAGNIGTVGVGTFQGDIDNYSCATKDATDPFYYYGNDGRCQKTLWYKFTPTITGNVRYRVYIAGTRFSDYWQVQLFRQIKPGDSTAAGLQIQGYNGVYDYSNGTSWAECCVSPGTYYLMITGCNQVNEFVYPEIELIEAVGDFCSRAVPAVLNGVGAVTASVLVNCHTSGTDYGEFGPQLTCPQGANTADYKTSWFRMDIGGTDTLDVTTYLVENTNAASSDIKYRLMTGDCGAMQEQSCVLDALTQNTYQCLVPGQSYYVQVFTPYNKFNAQVTGTIDLKLSAVAHADTCAPLANCLASANFTTVFNCNTDDSIKFVNFSTYGTSINYKWNFGYNGQTSTAVSPNFFYPALPRDTTYSVKLVVENIGCGKKDSVTKIIPVPGRPYINFGNDITSCNGASVLLTASSHTGATYTWQNASTLDTLRASLAGSNDYWVKINYNGCSSIDTVKVLISPIKAKALQNIILCTDSVSISASRGLGETYRWNTGATTAAIFASSPGIYWADVQYFSCTYRDSFLVNNVATAKPLGNDTTICITASGYTLRATTAGAISYTWQNGSLADTFKVITPGQYHVSINFGSCVVKDTVNIGGYPAPILQNTDTSICFGSSITLPWQTVVNTSGIYIDTLRFAAGCDSLIRSITVTVLSKPSIGRDTTLCLAQNPFVLNATTAGATSYLWQNGTSNAIFNVTAPGLYWVSVNFGNCSSRDSILISGAAAPVNRITDTSICLGFSLTLPWGKVVTTAGTYRDTIASYLSCDSIIQIVNLTIKSTPVLGNDTTISICSGSSFNLSNIYTTTALTSNWTLGGSPVANLAAVSLSGNYRLIVVNTGGCTDTAFVTLSFNPKPSLGNDTAISICQGNTYNLTTAYITTGLISNWTKNSSAVNNPSAVNTNGTYQLVATNTAGCTDTALITLTVNPKPALPKDSSIQICQGNTVNINTIYNTTGLATNWTLNNITVINPSNISANGTYRLIVTNVSGCTDTAFVTLSVNPKPSLGNDTAISICQGNTYNLTTAYNTTGLISNWTINSVAVNIPSAINTNGNYQLIATNTAGCADTAFITLTVNPKPALPKDSSIQICQGNTVNLNTIYNTTGLATNWTLNTIAVINPSNISVNGTYRLIATNVSGCTDTAFVIISVNPKPTLGNDSSINICQGNSSNLTAIYNTGSNINQWTKAGIAVTNQSAVNIAGSYQLISTTTNGCSDTVMLTLNIVANPIVVTNNPLPVCAPQTINLTDAAVTSGSTAALSFTYFTNAAATIIFNSATNAVSGTYFIKGTDNNGCFNIQPVTVTYYQKPIVNAGPDISICDKDSTILQATVTNISAPVTYQWEPVTAGGIVQPTASSTLVKPLSTQQYILTVNDTYGCNFNVKDSIAVTMQPPVIANAGNDTIASTGLPHQLNASGGTNYLWTPSGLLNNPNISNPLATIRFDTHFAVTVKDVAGCTGYDSVFVKVYDGITYYIPNAFSPNGDGRNDIFKPLAVGIISTEYFRIFNRYGQIVFETTQWNKGWDGIYKGVKQAIGNYVWVIKGKGSNGKIIEMKGNVVLVR